MNKKIAEYVLNRAGGKCEWCGRWCNGAGSLHHIVGGSGKRTQCERFESVIYICHDCHFGKYGATDYYITNKQMKMELQSYYFQNHTEDETRALMGGKLFLEKGQIVKGKVCRWL